MKAKTLIEFVVDTDTRSRGTRMLVDGGSATSLCDVKKVAVRVPDSSTPAPPIVPVEAPEVGDPDEDHDDA